MAKVKLNAVHLQHLTLDKIKGFWKDKMVPNNDSISYFSQNAKQQRMKKLLLVIFLVALGAVACARPGSAIVKSLYSDRVGSEANHTQVQGAGVVSRILSDDNEGSSHQRFILRLKSGQTLLVAHNIDLAPRVDSLKEGDTVEYSGEYKWNSKGGLVHWTHRDPSGKHVAGWLKHNGRIFQ